MLSLLETDPALPTERLEPTPAGACQTGNPEVFCEARCCLPPKLPLCEDPPRLPLAGEVPQLSLVREDPRALSGEAVDAAVVMRGRLGDSEPRRPFPGEDAELRRARGGDAEPMRARAGDVDPREPCWEPRRTAEPDP